MPNKPDLALLDMKSKKEQEHQKRIANARCQVDHTSPYLHIVNYLRVHNDKSDAGTYSTTLSRNMDMLQKINTIMRTSGILRTFRERPDVEVSNRPNNSMAIAIDEANKKILYTLDQVSHEVDTRWPVHGRGDSKKRVRRIHCFVAPIILEKYGFIQAPPKRCFERYFRPLIYFDISLKHSRRLGRLEVELFTEAAPQVVLEFVRAAMFGLKQQFSIIRVFPELWLEAELVVNEQALCRKQLEYDMRAVDHNSGPGILSFSRDFLKGFVSGIVNFSISFKPLNVLNGHRVGFGCITKGKKVLDFLTEYGTKNGKMIQQVYITGCGILD